MCDFTFQTGKKVPSPDYFVPDNFVTGNFGNNMAIAICHFLDQLPKLVIKIVEIEPSTVPLEP